MDSDDDLLEIVEDEHELQDIEDENPWLIAVIDDEKSIHQATSYALNSQVICGHRLQFLNAYSAKEGLELIKDNPDIAIAFIDVIMENETAGLDLVKQIREDLNNRQIRLIIRTGQPGTFPETQVTADYDIDDYLEKSQLTAPRLVNRITTAIRSYMVIQELEGRNAEMGRLLRQAAKLQSISRFNQASLFLSDLGALVDNFLKTANEIDLDCIVRIKTEFGVETVHTGDAPSDVENNIMNMASRVERIKSFGNDRAIFHWENAILLVRNLGDMIDTAALLMDGFQAGISSIVAQQKVALEVDGFNERNSQARNDIDVLYNNLREELNDVIISLAVVSALDEHDEAKLNAILEKFHAQIIEKLTSLKENNEVFNFLVAEMHTPPEGLSVDNILEGTSSVELF